MHTVMQFAAHARAVAQPSVVVYRRSRHEEIFVNEFSFESAEPLSSQPYRESVELFAQLFCFGCVELCRLLVASLAESAGSFIRRLLGFCKRADGSLCIFRRHGRPVDENLVLLSGLSSTPPAPGCRWILIRLASFFRAVARSVALSNTLDLVTGPCVDYGTSMMVCVGGWLVSKVVHAQAAACRGE